MSLFCWKKCQEQKLAKLEMKYDYKAEKQEQKTERTELRQESKQVGFQYGFDQGWGSQTGAALAPVADVAGTYFGGKTALGGIDKLFNDENGSGGLMIFAFVAFILYLILKK